MFTKEPGTIEWISNFELNSVFYDIGANVGIYTMYGCKRVKQVYAFEPHLGNCFSLIRNVHLNKADNIKVMSIALHNKVGFFNFDYRSDGIASSASQLDCNNLQYIPTCSEYKCSTTIDKLIGDSIIKPPTYVKIDVDGNEILILHGMQETLKNHHIKSLQVELGPNANEATEFLLNYGYKFQKEHFTLRGQVKLDAGGNSNDIIHNFIYTL